MDDGRVVRHPPRVLGGALATGIGFQLHVGLFVAHEARGSQGFKGRVGADHRLGVQHVAGHQSTAGAAAVHVVDLGAGHQRDHGVALKGFRQLQGNQFGSLLEERVLDGHFGHVGDRDLVTPLQRNRGDLADRHRLTDRRNAFGDRSERQGQTVVPGGGVGRAHALRKGQGVAELVGNELPAGKRKGLVRDVVRDVSRKVRSAIRSHGLFPAGWRGAQLPPR